MASPLPSVTETRCNAAYDAMMWALSRPGLPRDLPEGGIAVMMEALLDRECHAHCSAPEMAEIAARLGAHPAALDAADHVVLDAPPAMDVLPRLRQGSDLHPEDGATLIFHASIGTGPSLRLTGPGVDGSVEIAVDVPAELWTVRRDVMRYPMGFEMFIVDGSRVLGLPRTTLVEVL